MERMTALLRPVRGDLFAFGGYPGQLSSAAVEPIRGRESPLSYMSATLEHPLTINP
jgi:hypothetical protein